MLLTPFSCSCCQSEVSAKHFPLCDVCAESLIACPDLCAGCGGPHCGGGGTRSCTRPWITNPTITSFHARYLLLGQGYTVLKSWKKKQGPISDHRVLQMDKAQIEKLRSLALTAIIPIPQKTLRIWQMGGSASTRIGKWLGTLLDIPVVPLLLPNAGGIGSKRQAELPMADRMKNRIHFEINDAMTEKLANPHSARILIVDDFITSGHTVRNAANALRGRGVGGELHVFSLGLRVLRQFDAEKVPYRGERYGRPVPIRHEADLLESR